MLTVCWISNELLKCVKTVVIFNFNPCELLLEIPIAEMRGFLKSREGLFRLSTKVTSIGDEGCDLVVQVC
jgi:hypothetical protein